MKQQQHEIAALETKRTAQIRAVGMGLSSITVSSLPAIMKTGAQLSGLRKTDEASLIKALVVLIGLTNDALNVPRMNPMQMVDAARYIIKTYWYLKPEEVSYAFDRGRAGAYGTVYNRLDLEIVQGWLHKYDLTERLHISEQIRSLDAEKLEVDNRHSVEAVRQSYQRFKEGEMTTQQKIDAQRRDDDRANRMANHNYYVFREKYMAGRKPAQGEELPIDETEGYEPE